MGKRKARTLAEQWDVNELYEAAVQNVAEQCRFIDTTFNELRGRRASGFREDFCGSASAACEWVRESRARYAFGVDIDPGVLRWGRRNRLAELGRNQRQRMSLICGDVCEVETPPVDVVGAFNFSYWLFRKRSAMLRYFRWVHRQLGPEGVFFLDAYGGSATHEEVSEELEVDGFTYIWEQAKYNPVNGHMTTHIHFRFPDGSKIKKAFSYKWRLWQLPELQELLADAGFRNPTIHSEYTADDGRGTGIWFPVRKLPPVPAWIVNITAEK